MKTNRWPGALTAVLAVLAMTLLPAFPQSAHAKASPSVEYDAAEKCYYLNEDEESGDEAFPPGMYLLNTKANGKKFSGIYFVSGDRKISTEPGIHYVTAKKISGKRYRRGYYYFAKGGRLPKKAGVLYCEDSTVNDIVFSGYYCYNSSARILKGEYGLVSLNCTASDGRKFSGYYYRDARSRLVTSSAIRKITRSNGPNKKYRGYYFFTKSGKMSTKQTTRKLNLVWNETKYKGWYCFAGKDGKMIRKPGLVTMDRNIYYYVKNKTGKCVVDKKKKVNGFTYAFSKKGVGKRISTKLTSLEGQLRNQIAGYGGTWSIYVKRLDDNDSLTINNQPLYAASLMKVYIMASLYDQIQKGAIRDSAALQNLTRSMITVSSNDAANELVKQQAKNHSFLSGCSVVNQFISKNKYTDTSIHHTFRPSSHAFTTDGKSNATSVKDCGAILESIYRGTCVDSASSGKMLNLMFAQQRRGKIPAGVPGGVRIANKTGETDFADHDIAIVYSPRCTYILCVMSQNASNAPARISSISGTVYRYFN